MSFIESKKKRPGSFRHIWPNLGRYRIWTLAAAIFGGLEVMLEVLIPMLMSVIVDGGLYREQDFMLRELFPEALIANRDRFVLTVGIIMVIVACCSMACGILSARCSAVASQGFAKNLRANLLGKIQDFSFANTDHFTTSSLITRATTDVNTVRNTMQQFLRTLIRSPFMVLMATVMAFTISPHLAVIFLISIPFLAGVLAILMKIGQPRFRKMLQKMDSMNRAVQENLISSRVVKAYVRGDYESERFRGTAEDLRQATLSSSRLFTLTGPIQMSILWGCTIVLLLLGGREIIFRTTGLLTGELVSLVSYTTQAVNALTMLTWLIMALSRAHASLVRINEVLDETVDITDGPSDAVVEDGSVDFEDVCFSYSGDPDKLALRHITVHINSGETIGIIGGTGSAKSTLVNLIARLYDATEGTVRVGGVDVRDYDLDALRHQVAMVLQKNVLFSGTIAENLRWGDPNATDEEVREAAHLACADEFVDGFPKGYDTWIEQGGSNVSGGQKQRLCIARALLRRPKILILDDSTSAVDTKTDAKIRAGLASYLPNTTKLIIAQRISSVQDADRIIVMEGGRIAQIGNHDELLKTSEIYRETFTSQNKMSAEGEEAVEADTEASATQAQTQEGGEAHE